MLLVYSTTAGTGGCCKNVRDEKFTSSIYIYIHIYIYIYIYIYVCVYIFFLNKNGVDSGNISVFLFRTLSSCVLEILNWLVSDE